MRLVVKRDGHTVNEFQFDKGPIHIGRHADSQIFLPDRIISRHHAVIFRTQDGKWTVEDLDGDTVSTILFVGKSLSSIQNLIPSEILWTVQPGLTQSVPISVPPYSAFAFHLRLAVADGRLLQIHLHPLAPEFPSLQS